MIVPQRIMSRIYWAVQEYPPSSWTNTSPGPPSLSPQKRTRGFAPVLLKYRDRVTSLYQSDRGRRHGRNENEKSLGFTKETKAFSIVGVKGFEPSTLWSQTRCASQTALHPERPEF